MERKHIGGKGVSGRHSSVLPLAHALVVFCASLSCVDRCSPGRIMVKKTSVRSLKVARERGSLHVSVVERGVIQEVRVYGAKDAGTLDEATRAIELWTQEQKLTYRYIDKR